MSVTPENILDRWIEYVNSLEVENIVELYDDECIFMPTFSPHRISKPEQVEEYFRQLSTRKNMSVELHSGTLMKIEIGENKYVITGIYSFHFVLDDVGLTFPSRFTLIIDAARVKPIIHHHSSQVPRTLT